MRQLQDNQLITKLQDGDLEALGFLYDRHRHVVCRTALAITGDPEVAADLLQDVFLRLHHYAHRIDTERPLAPRLYRLTANLAYSWIETSQSFDKVLEGDGRVAIEGTEDHP